MGKNNVVTVLGLGAAAIVTAGLGSQYYNSCTNESACFWRRSEPSQPEEPAQAQEQPASAVDYYQQALAQGMDAAKAAGTANSEESWQAVAGAWESAIQSLKSVPTDNPNYQQAQERIKTYSEAQQVAMKRMEAAKVPPGYVTAAEYGEKWPFTVKSGTVKCLNTRATGLGTVSEIVFESGGKTYALNGTAGMSKKYLAVDPIWREDPASKVFEKDQRWKINIGSMIDLGLELCPN